MRESDRWAWDRGEAWLIALNLWQKLIPPLGGTGRESCGGGEGGLSHVCGGKLSLRGGIGRDLGGVGGGLGVLGFGTAGEVESGGQ